jgi:DNA-binding transcriptional LysR family regulator
VRLGEEVAKDMIAVRIGPDLRMAVVGSSSYFSRRPPPRTPRDLAAHDCINLRLPTYGGLLAWEFERAGHALKTHVEGQWVFNSSTSILRAALAGLGLAYVPEDMVREPLVEGRLMRVLEDWCPPFPGYHLYYPNRRHSSSALALLVDALRYHG